MTEKNGLSIQERIRAMNKAIDEIESATSKKDVTPTISRERPTQHKNSKIEDSGAQNLSVIELWKKRETAVPTVIKPFAITPKKAVQEKWKPGSTQPSAEKVKPVGEHRDGETAGSSLPSHIRETSKMELGRLVPSVLKTQDSQERSLKSYSLTQDTASINSKIEQTIDESSFANEKSEDFVKLKAKLMSESSKVDSDLTRHPLHPPLKIIPRIDAALEFQSPQVQPKIIKDFPHAREATVQDSKTPWASKPLRSINCGSRSQSPSRWERKPSWSKDVSTELPSKLIGEKNPAKLTPVLATSHQSSTGTKNVPNSSISNKICSIVDTSAIEHQSSSSIATPKSLKKNIINPIPSKTINLSPVWSHTPGKDSLNFTNVKSRFRNTNEDKEELVKIPGWKCCKDSDTANQKHHRESRAEFNTVRGTTSIKCYKAPQDVAMKSSHNTKFSSFLEQENSEERIHGEKVVDHAVKPLWTKDLNLATVVKSPDRVLLASTAKKEAEMSVIKSKSLFVALEKSDEARCSENTAYDVRSSSSYKDMHKSEKNQDCLQEINITSQSCEVLSITNKPTKSRSPNRVQGGNLTLSNTSLPKVLKLSHPSELDYDSELISLTNTTSKLKLKAVPRSLSEEAQITAFLRHSVTTPSPVPMLSHDSNIVGDLGDFKCVDECESVIMSKILETPVQSSSKANLGSCGNAASSVLTPVSLHDFLSKSDPHKDDTFETITDDSHERIELEYVKAQSSPRSSDLPVQSCTYFEKRPEGTQLMVSLLPEKGHQAIGESIPSVSIHDAYSPYNEMSKTSALDSETCEDSNPNAKSEKIFDGNGMTVYASPELDSKIVRSQKCLQLPTLQPLNEGNLTLSIYPSCTDSESNLSAHEESIELVDDATRILEIRSSNGIERIMTLHHEIYPPIPSKRLKTSKNPDSDKENDKCKASEAFHALKDYKALSAKSELALPLPIRKNSKEIVDSDASDSCTCEEKKVSEKLVSEIPEVTIQNEVEGKPKNSYLSYGIEGKKKESSIAYFETEKVMLEGNNERKPSFNASTRNRAEMWSKRVKSLRTMDNEHLVDVNKSKKSSSSGANESQALPSKLIALAKKYKGTPPSDEARDHERRNNNRISKLDISVDLGEKSNRSNNSMANFMVRKSVIPTDTPPRTTRRRKRVAQKHLNSTLKSEAVTKDPIEKQVSITAKASLRSTATEDDQCIKGNGRNEDRNEEKEISEANLKMKPTTSTYVECSRTESLMNPQPGTFQIKALTKSDQEFMKQHETQNVSTIGSTKRYQHNNEATQNSISGEAGISKIRQFEKMRLSLSSTSTKESNIGQTYHCEEEHVREHGNYKLDPLHLEKQRLELSEKTDESKEREMRDLDCLDKGVKEVLSIEDRMKRTECAPKRTDNRKYRLGKNLVKNSFNRKRTTGSEFKGLSSEKDVGHIFSSTESSKGGQCNISGSTIKESEASLCSRNNNSQNQVMCQSQGIHALHKFESSRSCIKETEALVPHNLRDVTKESAARNIPTDLGIDTGLYNMRQSDCQDDMWGEKMLESENSTYIPDTLSPRNSIFVTPRGVAINLEEDASFHESPAMLNDTQSNVSASSGASNLTERAFRALNLRRNVAGQELEIVKKSNEDVPSLYIITKHQSSDLNQTAKEGFKDELTTRTLGTSFGRSTLANRYTLTDRFLHFSYSTSEMTEGHEGNEEKKKVQDLSNRTESNLSSMIAASSDAYSENFSNDQANITISRNSSADVFGIDANFPNQSSINLSAMKNAYDKLTATELAKDFEQEIKLTLGGSIDAVKSLAKEIEKLTKINPQNEFDDQPPQVFCENSTAYEDGDEDIAIEVEYIEDDNNEGEVFF